MATRGTAILITNETVNFGPEFNGDMYPHGNGNKFMELLSEVKNNIEFIKMNNSFNKENFGYDKIMSKYQGQIEPSVISENDVLSLSKMYKSFICTSDWFFIKNIKNETVSINSAGPNNTEIKIEIRPNETVRFEFGVFENNGKNRISM